MLANATAPDNAPGRQRPVHEVRLGAIKAAIWRNDTSVGARHNVTFSRLFREAEQWRSVNLHKPAIVNFSAKAWRHGAALRAPRVSVPVPHRFTPGREPPNVGSDLFAPGGSLPYGLPVGAGGYSHG